MWPGSWCSIFVINIATSQRGESKTGGAEGEHLARAASCESGSAAANGSQDRSSSSCHRRRRRGYDKREDLAPSTFCGYSWLKKRWYFVICINFSFLVVLFYITSIGLFNSPASIIQLYHSCWWTYMKRLTISRYFRMCRLRRRGVRDEHDCSENRYRRDHDDDVQPYKWIRLRSKLYRKWSPCLST